MPTPKILPHVHRASLRSTEEHLNYMTDCTLATVCDLAGKKSRSKSEYQRQISIAQLGVDHLRNLPAIPAGRAADIIQAGMTVAEWAKQYEVAK